jgi:ABC-2 type transport system permease protein
VKLLDITLKDMLQSARSLVGLVFMFAMPILLTGLFFIMFGGSASEEGFDLPNVTVLLVNQDEGQFPAGAESYFSESGLEVPGGGAADLAGASSMGDVLSRLLLGEPFRDFMDVSQAQEAAAARLAVDNQEAGVAIIIPANFTAALSGMEEETTIELYQDPTLTIGPAIVAGVLSQIVDTFAAATIGSGVTIEQLAESGVAVDTALIQEIVGQFTSQGPTAAGNQAALIELRAPAGEEGSTDLLTEIVSLIMGGMMVFFAFFTGAATMGTILTEEETGTLGRLFTTPTAIRTIIGGKSAGSLLTVVVQVSVLMTFGALVFSIYWGETLTAILAAAGLVLVAGATGLFLNSLLKDTRQAGIIYGGVLTLTGMLGLIPVFTAGAPNQSETVRTISLLVPQGWAMRGLTIAMDGGSVADLLPTLLVVLLWTAAFAFIGLRRFKRRFD